MFLRKKVQSQNSQIFFEQQGGETIFWLRRVGSDRFARQFEFDEKNSRYESILVTYFKNSQENLQ